MKQHYHVQCETSLTSEITWTCGKITRETTHSNVLIGETTSSCELWNSINMWNNINTLNIHVRHNSFKCIKYGWGHPANCVWHDSCTCETWRIYMCGTKHPSVAHMNTSILTHTYIHIAMHTYVQYETPIHCTGESATIDSHMCTYIDSRMSAIRNIHTFHIWIRPYWLTHIYP